jgi:hypothetical protein
LQVDADLGLTPFLAARGKGINVAASATRRMEAT